MANDSRQESALTNIAMQSCFPPPLDLSGSKSLEIFSLEKLNHQTLAPDGTSFQRFFQSNPSDASRILPAVPLRIFPSQEEYHHASRVNSLSETSTESQSAQNTDINHSHKMGFESPSGRHFTTWSDRSPRAETSTSIDGDGKDDNRLEGGGRGDLVVASGSSDQDRGKTTDSKVLRRLAQNREAARKSRLRKKAYVQQLESSRVKLNQLEQELERVRQQGMYMGGPSGDRHPGVAVFDMDYARWVEESNLQISELRSALAAHVTDNDLRALVDKSISHYNELFRLKGIAVKADVFHIVSGMWKTPAERCFMWMGGFRPSELLKVFNDEQSFSLKL